MYLLLLLCSIFALCVCNHTILYNTHSDLRIATISNTKKFNSHILAKDLRYASSITYLYNASLICWVEEDSTDIQCASFNGTNIFNRAVYTKMVPSGEGIACDWLTKKLYWTDRAERRIEVLSLENKCRKVLYWEEIDQPRGIAVDPTEGLLFWTDWGESPAIERASMDGDSSLRKRIIEKDLFWPNSVALDVHSKKVYWIDGKFCSIEATNYDGSERTVLVDKGLKYPRAYPYSLSVSDTKFFWTDWGTHSVYSTDRVDSQYADLLIQSSDHPIFDIHIYDANLQPYAATPCDRDNGGCSHLCLLSAGPRKYSCACPTGIRLLDQRTCASEEENILFLAQRTEIRRVSLDTPDHTSILLPIRVKHAVGIDIDPVDRYFYWTDQDIHSISRAKFDGSQEETVVSSDMLVADGIAVDWIAKNLYWCDGEANRIEVARLKTNYRRVVVFEDIDQPRAVVVHPLLGWLFWSEWNDVRPKIERSDLDGSNRLILVKTDIIWPNCLALDYESRKLYFGDARTDRIEVVGVDGRDRREVLSEDLLHIFGLTVLGDYLYWTDWSRRTLESANKYSPRVNRSQLVEQLPDVMGLKAISRHVPNGTNPCAVNNGGCTHFCLYKPDNRYVCACQVEYELHSDMKGCTLSDSYFMVLSHNRIRRVSIRTNNTDVIPINEVKSISAIDVSPSDRRVYWADSRMKTINRGYINGSHIEMIVSCGLQSPESVALDWLSWNVYWADASLRRIEVVSLSDDSHLRRTLFWGDLNNPRNLVVDPRVGFMFWSEWNRESGMIVKAHMDGSVKRTIVDVVGHVNGLSIDYTHRYLYWTHSKNENGFVERCDAVGQNRKVIFQEVHFVPVSITHSHDYLFWTKNSSIVQLHMHSGVVTMDHTLSNSISNLSVVDSAKQGGVNSCVMNTKCKNLCLVRPGFEPHLTEATCTCPTHYTMRGDVCQPPENFLLFSQRNALFRLTTNISECPDFPLMIPGLKGVRAIEYDSATKHVYWIESKTKKTSTIKRSTEKDSNVEVIVASQEDLHFWDIAIEPFSKLLFWTSSTSNSINVTRLDNTSVGCIFESKNNNTPRSLAIHPEKGLLFWTIAGSQQCIVQSRLNGEDQLTIDTESRLADALAVDRRSSVLYLTYGGRLYAYNIADRIRRPLLEKGSGKVLSLAIIRSWLYWVSRDADTQRIERVNVNVNTVSDRTVIIQHSNFSHLSHIIDLIAVDPEDDSYPHHPCSTANNHGNCSHLCLPSTKNLQEAECGCPLTLELNEDRQTCIVPLPSSTPAPEPEREAAGCRVENGVTVCDGVVDCPEGSEESGGSCSGKSIAMKDKYPEGNSSIQFLIAFVILISLALVGVWFYFKQKSEDTAESKFDMAVMRPLAMTAPRVCQSATLTSPSHSPISLINGPSSVISYPPSHLTGISSSSSMIHCPLNPPPSPTTTTMQQDECSCSEYAGPVPMPTPCSTDVCESDASYPSFQLPYVSDRRNRSRRQNRHQQQRLQNNNYEEMPYRSSEDVPPPPPPPTPNNLKRYNYPNSFG